MKTINVKGAASLSAHPDCTEIRLTVRHESGCYETAVAETDKKAAEIASAAEAAGLDKDALKSTGYRVDSKYEYVQDKGVHRNEFKGYECVHDMVLRMPFDRALLAKTVSVLSASKACPEFHIRFTLLDKSALGDELMSAAVKDGIRKARLLAQAAGVTLGAIESITFDAQNISPYSRTEYNPGGARKAMALAADIRPEDVCESESVHMVFEII